MRVSKSIDGQVRIIQSPAKVPDPVIVHCRSLIEDFTVQSDSRIHTIRCRIKMFAGQCQFVHRQIVPNSIALDVQPHAHTIDSHLEIRVLRCYELVKPVCCRLACFQ